jgi:hypothetical protein
MRWKHDMKTISRTVLVLLLVAAIGLAAGYTPFMTARAGTTATAVSIRPLAAGNKWASTSPHVWYRVVTSTTTVTLKFYVTTDKTMNLLISPTDNELRCMVDGPSLVYDNVGMMVPVAMPNGKLTLSVGDNLVATITVKRPAKAETWTVTMLFSGRDSVTKRAVTRYFADAFGVGTLQQPEIYVNKTLGFSLAFPREWKGRYVIRDEKSMIGVYSKKVSDSDINLGRLFTIERLNGETIKEGDPIMGGPSAKILLKGNGYTYIVFMVSDQQYPIDNSELSTEYLSLSKQISLVYSSIALLH